MGALYIDGLMCVELSDFIIGHAVSMAFLQSYTDVAVKLKGSVLWYACLFFELDVKLCKTILNMQKTPPKQTNKETKTHKILDCGTKVR